MAYFCILNNFFDSDSSLSICFVVQPIEVKDVESIDPEYFKNLGDLIV